MLSSQQLLNFGSSNLNFLEDNLLDQDDWKGDNDAFDFMNYDSSPSSSSLDSDQTSSNVSPISLHNDDDIDDWLQEGLIYQHSPTINPLIQEAIKEEPPSPPSINPNDMTISQVHHVPAPVSTIAVTLPPPATTQTSAPIKKVPISRITRPIAPLNSKIITTQKHTSVGKIPSSNVLQLKPTLPTLPVKSEQLNTAFLPGEKYAVPPKIVKLENGQYYIARTVLKGTQPKKSAVVPGQKRSSPTLATASITKDYGDLKDMKRQQRMIKNRESASLSRQRKKEHLSTLEGRVNQISAMNAHLQEENQKLKERVQQLESENIQLKGKMPADDSSGHTTVNKENIKKTSTVVMAILLFVIFNPFPLSSHTSSKDGTLLNPPSFADIPKHYRSRALLQYDNSNNIDYTYDAPFNPSYMRNIIHSSLNTKSQKQREGGEQQVLKFGRRAKPKDSVVVEQDILEEDDSKIFPPVDSDCGETFNKTDVNRINKILEGLVKVYDKNENSKRKKARSQKPGVLSKFPSRNCTGDEENQPKPLIAPFMKRLKMNGKQISKTQHQQQPPKAQQPNTPPLAYYNSSQELVNEIRRTVQQKDDTFYVLSMKDFFILPATNQSQQHRPKFSFIVPAFLQASNDSSIQEVSMLQIDCNVLDTKLVQLNKKILSKHFSSYQLEHSTK